MYCALCGYEMEVTAPKTNQDEVVRLVKEIENAKEIKRLDKVVQRHVVALTQLQAEVRELRRTAPVAIQAIQKTVLESLVRRVIAIEQASTGTPRRKSK